MWSGLHATFNTLTPPTPLVDIQQGNNISVSTQIFPERYQNVIFVSVLQSFT